MTPDEIAAAITNLKTWSEIEAAIAAAIAAERAAREKAEAELEADRAQCMGCLTDDEKDQTISELSARAEKAEAAAEKVREDAVEAILHAFKQDALAAAARAGFIAGRDAACDVLLTKCHDNMTREEEAEQIRALEPPK